MVIRFKLKPYTKASFARPSIWCLDESALFSMQINFNRTFLKCCFNSFDTYFKMVFNFRLTILS